MVHCKYVIAVAAFVGVAFLTPSLAQSDEIFVTNNSCIPIDLDVLYYDPDNDSWKVEGPWHFRPGAERYLARNGNRLYTDGNVVYYSATSKYWAYIWDEGGILEEGSHYRDVQTDDGVITMKKFDDDFVAFDIDLVPHAEPYGRFDKGDCNYSVDHTANHLSLVAGMACHDIEDIFACTDDAVKVLNVQFSF